ncbi:unnamed protein product [Urochloa humidicola]
MSSPPKKPQDPGVNGSGNKDKHPARSPTPPPRHRPRSPSRRPRRSRPGDARTQEVVIERLIEKGSLSAITYPRLTRTNYQEWSLVMKVNFQAQGLWGAIDLGECKDREDRLALAVLLRAVPTDMWSTLARKDSVKEPWEAVKTIRVGVQRVRETNAQQLWCEFADIRFKEGESVDDFSLWINTLADNLRALGEVVTDAEVVKKMLQVVPETLDQVACSIEMLLDLNTTTVEDVTGRLRIFEQRRSKPNLPTNAMGRLLLSEEEWAARQRARSNQGGSSRGPSSGSNGKRRGKPRTRSGVARASRDDVCKSCSKTGHWAKDCRSRPRGDQAHMAQDDEPMLLLLEASVDPAPTATANVALPIPAILGGELTTTPPPSIKVEQIHARAPQQEVYLVEEKLYGTIGDEEDQEPCRWVLDTGATNHMTGSRAAFVDLDSGISGTVRFGSGSVITIEGCGTVVLTCKNGKHRALDNVYYLLRLTTHIISIEQLDELEFQVQIEDGVMCIWDEHHRLLAKVCRSSSFLYILDIKLARPVCLAAHVGEDAWR